MPTIAKISARTITDSRHKETIEVSVVTKSDRVGVAAVPGGTSTGSFEASVLPVDQSIRIIEELLAPRLAGMAVDDQRAIDSRMIALDGSERKERLGGNTLIGVSMAVARAAAQESGQPLYRYLAALSNSTPSLPLPLCVMIEGGKHGSSPRLTFQEFSIGAPLPKAKQIYDALASKLTEETGLEGAFAPDMSNLDALTLLTQTVEAEGFTYNEDVLIGLDFAASSMDRPPEVTELVDLAANYPIGLMEDPLPEEAWHLWAQLRLELKSIRKDILIVGDDLFVTNRKRLTHGINELIANAILIKPNQVGTVTETLDVIQLARANGFAHIVSHRSGETMDDFIADLAAGTAAAYLKAGPPSNEFAERAVKYTRLAEIAGELGVPTEDTLKSDSTAH